MIEEGFEDYLEEFEEGRVLFRQGETGDSFYVIKDGLVGIIRREDKAEERIATVGPGEVLGEMALLNPDQELERSATARSMTATTCWKFDEEQFHRLMADNEDFRRKILGHLGSRLRKASSELAQAHHSRDRLYEASVGLLKFMSEKRLFSRRIASMHISMSPETIARYVDVSERDLKVYLSAPDTERLQQLPEHLTATAREVAGSIVDEALETLEFDTPYEGDYPEDEDSDDISSLEEACQTAESLNETLSEGINRITRRKYEDVWDTFETIKECLRDSRQNPTADETMLRRLEAFVKGIRKKLQSVNRDSLDA